MTMPEEKLKELILEIGVDRSIEIALLLKTDMGEQKAKEFLKDLFSKMKPYTSSHYPDSIFYKLDNLIVMEQDNVSKHLWCSNSLVWGKVEAFSMCKDVLDKMILKTYHKVESLIKNQAEEHLKLQDYTPNPIRNFKPKTVKEFLKFQSDASFGNGIFMAIGWEEKHLKLECCIPTT